MDLEFDKYELDVQNYLKAEWNAADIPMYKDEVYINKRGKTFIILKDSDRGNSYVKVRCEDNFGTYIGYRPKIVLIS